MVQDHAGTFINIAAAKGKDQITGLGIPIDIIRHGLEGGQADTAGDLFAQILRGDVVGIDLPAAHDGRKHHAVGDGQGGDKVLQQHIGAAKGEGLEHGPYTLKVQLLGGGEGGAQLGGVVGIVIGDSSTFMRFAQHLKAAAGPGKGRKPGGSLLRGGAQLHGARGGGNGIEDIVVAGDLQVDLGWCPPSQR